MANETPEQLRQSAMKFSLEAYQKVKHNRAYALDEQNKVALAALARAMYIRRIEEGRSHNGRNAESLAGIRRDRHETC